MSTRKRAPPICPENQPSTCCGQPLRSSRVSVIQTEANPDSDTTSHEFDLSESVLLVFAQTMWRRLVTSWRTWRWPSRAWPWCVWGGSASSVATGTWMKQKPCWGKPWSRRRLLLRCRSTLWSWPGSIWRCREVWARPGRCCWMQWKKTRWDVRGGSGQKTKTVSMATMVKSLKTCSLPRNLQSRHFFTFSNVKVNDLMCCISSLTHSWMTLPFCQGQFKFSAATSEHNERSRTRRVPLPTTALLN